MHRACRNNPYFRFVDITVDRLIAVVKVSAVKATVASVVTMTIGNESVLKARTLHHLLAVEVAVEELTWYSKTFVPGCRLIKLKIEYGAAI
jgi:hypothetical protein